MKRLLTLALILASLSLALQAQNARYSAPFPSVSSTTVIPFLVANVPPNSPLLSVCNSPANQVPCTNYATTFTRAGVACSNGAQDTPDPQPSACQATGDAQGNMGFWAPPGKYDYTVCIQNTIACFGPYTVTLALGGGTASGMVKCTDDAYSNADVGAQLNACIPAANGLTADASGLTGDYGCNSAIIPAGAKGTLIWPTGIVRARSSACQLI